MKHVRHPGPARPALGGLTRQVYMWQLLAMLIACGASAVRADDGVTCATCHKTEQEEFAQSVHVSLACQECHGGTKKYDVATDLLASLTGRTEADAVTFDHGTEFKGKPARADVPTLCGECHADVARMNPYGIRTDQLSRYWTSGHGKTLREKGDDRVAVCIDCHGAHEIRPGHEPGSRTHPLRVPAMCAMCHADKALMAEYNLPVEVVDEYRQSVHGSLLFEQGDTGAPTCATCHGNHSAMPPGFASVGDVCGQCHHHTTEYFKESTHASQSGFRGCVQCHGGGEDRHYHKIERIMQPPGVMIQRYSHLLTTESRPTAPQVADAIHPDPKKIIMRALPTCTECHEELEDDESLPKLFNVLDDIAAAELKYVETASRLNRVGQGVVLVDKQRFLFEDAKTHLIALAPLQHTLNNDRVSEKVQELNAVCDQVNAELDKLESGVRWRHKALIPIWIFSAVMAIAFYVKFKQLKAYYVKPMPKGS